MAEMRGFVFAIMFLVIYGALLSSMPAGFTDSSFDDPAMENFDPALLGGFGDTETYNQSSFSSLGPLLYYDYSIGGYYFRNGYLAASGFIIGSKVLFFGLWLGELELLSFSFAGADRGTVLNFTDIDQDAINGQVRYNTQPLGGGVVFAWDLDEYADSETAWDADELQILHGVGANEQAPTNVLGLLLGLLTLSIPDIPLLVQAFIVTPIYASVLYLAWFIIKEVIPF